MKSNKGMSITARIGAGFIKMLGSTWNIRWFNEEYVTKARQSGGPVIYVFWHGRLLPLSYTHRHRSVHVLASEHPDGELMGRTIECLGFGHVRGSSSKGGARAVKELSRKIKDDFDLGITVDGPKGPKFKIKSGALEIAKLTGAPIVPITTGSRRHWTFRSWDEFQFPAPFTRVCVFHGEPLSVPSDITSGDLEDMRVILERRLQSVTKECDEESRR